MATSRAIRAACEAVLKLLESRFSPSLFDDESLDFELYYHSNFQDPMDVGVSLYLYRVYINTTHRIPPGRITVSGDRYDTILPVDLHILLTIWAKDVTTQMEIAGWMMRVLEDTPVLSGQFINTTIAGTFRDDESVGLLIGELAQEDILRIWETLRPNYYQLSVPYVLRNVRIDSEQITTPGKPVHDRQFEMRELEAGNV